MLLVLRNAPPKLRKIMLKHVSPEIIKAICEIAYNVLHNNVKICHKTHAALRTYCAKKHIAQNRKSHSWSNVNTQKAKISNTERGQCNTTFNQHSFIDS